jgi:hypothetical protein
MFYNIITLYNILSGPHSYGGTGFYACIADKLYVYAQLFLADASGGLINLISSRSINRHAVFFRRRLSLQDTDVTG